MFTTTTHADPRITLTDPQLLPAARRIAGRIRRRTSHRLDLHGGRSVPWRLARAGGAPLAIGAETAGLVAAALAAARVTGGLADATVGNAVLRYEIAAAPERANRWGAVPDCAALDDARPQPVAGMGRVQVDGARVAVPTGTLLDLAPLADPLLAAAIARAVAARLPVGVAVDLGGDVVQAGPARPGGWTVRLPDGSALRLPPGRGCATVRPRADRPVIDPRTGRPADPVWSWVTVTHRDPLHAKALALAAVVLGSDAPGWLRQVGAQYRLGVRQDAEHAGPPSSLVA